MRVETVKVYKGKEAVTVNKTDVELWNKYGYKTSSQQKSAVSDNKKADKE